MSRRWIVLVSVTVLALLGGSLAVAAKKPKPKNGNFESGDFSRWKVQNVPADSGDWFVYSGTELPDEGDPFFAPPQGTFAAAVSVEEPGLHILHRTLKLKQDQKHTLKLRVYYDNEAGEFASPPTLEAGDEGGPPENQQYRIDVLKKKAPLDSLDGGDILKKVFATQPDDPIVLGPTKVKKNLSKFAGKKVRLRLAEVDNLGELHAAVDAVKLKSKPKN